MPDYPHRLIRQRDQPLEIDCEMQADKALHDLLSHHRLTSSVTLNGIVNTTVIAVVG